MENIYNTTVVGLYKLSHMRISYEMSLNTDWMVEFDSQQGENLFFTKYSDWSWNKPKYYWKLFSRR